MRISYHTRMHGTENCIVFAFCAPCAVGACTWFELQSRQCTPVFRCVVLLILRMRFKELEMQIDLGTCANLNRTTDLKTGVLTTLTCMLKPRVNTRLQRQCNFLYRDFPVRCQIKTCACSSLVTHVILPG